MAPFTLLIKPAGSDCNLNCKYCFYKDRALEVGQGRQGSHFAINRKMGAQRMSDEVLERLVKDYMKLRLPASGFAWQGGEPMLMGLDFYKKAVELQKKYGGGGQEVSNALQTNAILLEDRWCRFLHDNKFLVGISIDGPKEFHDYYRVDHAGSGSFDKVMGAIETCKKYKVEFNTLILLNNKNVEHPDELFDFFIEIGSRFLQFIPCVELDPRRFASPAPVPALASQEAAGASLRLGTPYGGGGGQNRSSGGKIADFSITPQQYGKFLCRTFDRWYDYGPQNLSIRDFESILSYCAGGKHTICTFERQCSQYIVIEHTGDAFCCDFFVGPKWRLGNIFETPIEKLAAGSKKRSFARAKQNLCNKCLVCRDLAVCRGGCLKDRRQKIEDGGQRTEDRTQSPEGERGVESYFCESYKRFFDYAMPRFMQIAAAVSAVRD